MSEEKHYQCMNCGESDCFSDEEISDGYHVVAEADADGDPQPAQCGPIVPYEPHVLTNEEAGV